MKYLYLILSIVGFVLPNIWVAKVSAETGNFLLWFNPKVTFSSMFANDIASAFAVDLLFVVVVFFIWTYREARNTGVRRIHYLWAATLLFGLAGGFPLFLYLRERVKESKAKFTK